MIQTTDREKLIELIRKSGCVQTWDYHTDDFADPNPILALADHLLANGVIVPPCKVGDIVYLPCLTDWGDIENYTITEFVLDNDGLLFVVDDEDRETHPIEEIGTEVFLTKEEAEAELEKRYKNEKV